VLDPFKLAHLAVVHDPAAGAAAAPALASRGVAALVIDRLRLGGSPLSAALHGHAALSDGSSRAPLSRQVAPARPWHSEGRASGYQAVELSR
jgi:hypothetical protein